MEGFDDQKSWLKHQIVDDEVIRLGILERLKKTTVSTLPGLARIVDKITPDVNTSTTPGVVQTTGDTIEGSTRHTSNTTRGSSSIRFPGALPIGLRSTALNYISDPSNRLNYVVTAKLDGIRMLAVIVPEGCFLVDRALVVYSIGPSPLGTLNTSIYDGELMSNQCFMVFDAMMVDGLLLVDLSFGSRYDCMCAVLIPLDLEIRTGSTVLRLIPKRMYTLLDISTLLELLVVQDTHSFSIRTADMMHPGCVRTTDSDLDNQLADGLIFMDRSDVYAFTRSAFGLLKWKCTPTYDVLVEMKDLCRLDGVARYSSQVPTHYVEYSERMRRPVRMPFVGCMISKTQRVQLWTEKMGLRRSATLCVECFYDGTHWRVLRGRPDKRRSNSGRTIRDTWWLEKEQISLERLIRSVTWCPSDVYPSRPLPRDDHTDLRWLERTWAASSVPCELEVRLLYMDKTSIPADMFHRVVRFLRIDPSMVAREYQTKDYTCGHLRVTQTDGKTLTMEKELGFRRDFRIPGHPLLGVRCALSYEHPTNSYSQRTIEATFSTLRRKHRWSFVFQDRFVIDCTHVQPFDWLGIRDAESYEIEIELLSPELLDDDRIGVLISKLIGLVRVGYETIPTVSI